MMLLSKEHLIDLQSVTNPELAPDEQQALFLRTVMNEQENTYNTHLFHIHLVTNKISQWTFGNETVTSPKWSPSGEQVAFLAKRGEKQQLYLLNTSGGEAQPLTDFPVGVQSFLWSPCGEGIWLTSSLKEGYSFTEPEEKKDDKFLQAYVVDRMKYKEDGTGGSGLKEQDRFTQIGFLTIATKEVEAFTAGNYLHTLWDISKDSQKLIIGVNRQQNNDSDFQAPLYLVDIATKQETVLIDEDGYYEQAVFSEDDRYIAYTGYDMTYKNATHTQLYIYDIQTAVTQNLTAELDAPVGDMAVADVQQRVSTKPVLWTATNDLYFQLSTMGDVRLYYATLEGAIYPASPEEEHIYSFTIFKDGNRALATISNPTEPGELFNLDITTGERTQLTSFNEALIQEVTLVKPEPIVFETFDGQMVHGWIMKPAQFIEGESYPLIVEVHGGPHAMYANTFFHELQLLAAEGYGVLYINPRGSHGYSQSFVDAVRADYGGGDYEDIMAALDYAIANYAWIDENRLGVTGGSYGGFMTNWIVGHTDRFKAAVTQRSITNWVSFFGVSDIGYYFTEWQIAADMQDVEKLWAHSPLKYASQIETPLLILHSEKDFRCPIEQAEQLYITLKRMGKEVGFVRFPESDHNLSRVGRPNLRIQRLQKIVEWFAEYL